MFEVNNKDTRMTPLANDAGMTSVLSITCQYVIFKSRIFADISRPLYPTCIGNVKTFFGNKLAN